MKKRKRKKGVLLYLSEDELNLVDKGVLESAERNRSEYIRKMLFNGYIIKPNYEYSRKIVYELNKIGVNLNQITAKINSDSNNKIFLKELVRWGKELDDLWQLHILEGKVKDQDER